MLSIVCALFRIFFFVFLFHTMVAGGHFGYSRRVDVDVSYVLHPCVIQLRMYSVLVICRAWDTKHLWLGDTTQIPLKRYHTYAT